MQVLDILQSVDQQFIVRVDLVTVTGNGESATADITVTNGVAVAATIVAGGSGYALGDVLNSIIFGRFNNR